MTRWPSLLAIAVSMLPGLAPLAIESEAPLADPALQARYERLTEELRCLVCQNQNIADSNADLAADLRRQVRDMLLAGASDDEIMGFMVQRYGDFVLYRPPFKPETWLLWLAPALLLLLGLVIAIRVVVRRSRLYREEPPEEGAASGHSA